MIVFELICADHHRFEGWFASNEDFSAQKKGRLLTCPLCGSESVEKLPTARIGKTEVVPAQAEGSGAPAVQAGAKVARAALNELIDYVLLHTEDVGSRFADEARRIHQEQAPRRDIRGTATREEAKELVDDGIPVMPLPIPPQGEWH